MEFPNCLTLAAVGNSFCSVPTWQAWQDFALWEAFLERHYCRSVIELGTFYGGFALFLALQCEVRGMDFVTIDNKDICPASKWLDSLGTKRLKFDLLSEGAPHIIANLRSSLSGPVILFCDNGNKIEEVRRFAPLLKANDYLAVHDWGTEFHSSDVPTCLEMVFKAESESVQSMTRFFKVL
jgi:cephalosporin hydroxylase